MAGVCVRPAQEDKFTKAKQFIANPNKKGGGGRCTQIKNTHEKAWGEIKGN